ncbi:probable cytochrome P450 6a13 isoform X2 [Thrips palmi]|uniref:Probable cytochrome P450 6a13 isoform X2 n=1 Tax=Thrips palmi TaxID=161013 RepID=A0A6P8YT49_THRPL|nr:probable cytochrome P450 6a13 isoform X2 [Thrips palmi]
MAVLDATGVLAAVLAALLVVGPFAMISCTNGPTMGALWWSRRRQSYWSERGVPTPPSLPFVGSIWPVMTGRKSFAQHLYDIADHFREHGYCGMYSGVQRTLLVFDPEMAKQILCKDFGSFHDRGFPTSDSDPLSQHLISLSGSKWRNLRNRLSPTFTSGKLKLMFPLMRDVGDQLNATMAKEAHKAGGEVVHSKAQKADGEVDLSALLHRYTVDMIGSIAFGINCNCLVDENAEFLAMSRGVFTTTPAQFLRFMLMAIHPKLGSLLPFKLVFSKVHRFFLDLMRSTVEHREKHEVVRNDFVDIMMQARDKDHGDPDNNIALTTEVMAAQGFIFFVAGLDNVSNTVAYVVHRMAQDPALQQRVADEVLAVINKHAGEVTYEGLKEMDLVDRVLQEGLRLWSPGGLAMRKCNKTTMVGDVLVEKDTNVMIVSHCMHKNPAIFPDPERFDPERHTAEARQQRHPYAFIPFGEGPRVCLAERFALLEMKLALVMLVRDFEFARGPRFEASPAVDTKAFFPRPVNGFLVRVQNRG